MPTLEPLYLAIDPPKSEHGQMLGKAATISAEEGALLSLAAAQKSLQSDYSSSATEYQIEFLPTDVSAGARLASRSEIFERRVRRMHVLRRGTRQRDYGQSDVPSQSQDLAGYLRRETVRQMRGPEWDEPKQCEVSTLQRMGAFTKTNVDDPKIKGWRVVETMFTGRSKRNAEREVIPLKGRCVLRDDLHKSHCKVDGNQCMPPVARNVSACAIDAVSALRCQHIRSFDVSSDTCTANKRRTSRS